MTTIEITINGVQIFKQRHTRHLSDKDIRKTVREGCIGIDRSRAVITTKYE